MNDHNIQLEVGPLDGKQRIVVVTLGNVSHTDRLDLLSDSKRTTYIKRAAERLGVEEESLRHLHEELPKQAIQVDEEISKQAEQIATVDKVDYLDSMPAAVSKAAKLFLINPKLIEELCGDFAIAGIAGEKGISATIYLVGTSRLLDRPMAAINQGGSSTGKSHVIERVGRMFPSEEVVRATQMSPQSLFYMTQGSLSHKFVVAGERSRAKGDENAEATRAPHLFAKGVSPNGT